MSEWLPVAGFDGFYDVSSDGQVRTWRKRGNGTGKRRDAPVLLAPACSSSGYLTVRLYTTGGPGKSYQVHQLVMQAFVGPPPPGLEVCHGNGQPHDNRLINLRYDTRSANCRERVYKNRSLKKETVS